MKGQRTLSPFLVGFLKAAGQDPSVISDWVAESDDAAKKTTGDVQPGDVKVDPVTASADYPADAYYRYW